MNVWIISYVMIASLMLSTSGLTREKGSDLKELNLSDEQTKAVQPILLKYAQKRQNYLQSLQEELTINKSKAKADLKQIRKEENQELSQFLTPEQMQKRMAKQNLKDSLNQGDVFDFKNQEEATITPQGGSMQF